ncbi:hypothetical protein BP6252_11098 [Coleophoma cylindrospora]|uniref:Isochorismatase-like domain-containing protein n=1 Tax=Coleophoma cylindrospora TaxID=1849047 RepID=A0A3D8QP04_9HELO|nr:hypothetical protein BP6252_11098 [Coleophoma cylindrospora]
MSLLAEKTALIVVDVQSAFLHPTYWGPSRSNPAFESNATSIIKSYRLLISGDASSSPHKIIHVAHASLSTSSPLHRSSPGFKFQKFAEPQGDELVIEKSVNSAFIGTNLEEVLRDHFKGSKGTMFLLGLTTDHCVSTTTRMASNLKVCDGLDGENGEVVFIEDATAAWKKSNDGFDAELVHAVNAESLQEFASVRKTAEVLESWKGLLESKA